MEFLGLAKQKLIRKENMSSAWLPVLMKREEALLLIVWRFCFVGLIVGFCCFVGLIVFVCFGFFNLKLASKSFSDLVANVKILVSVLTHISAA